MSLIARDIHVTLGRKEVLQGVSFSAEPGRVTAIVGPNGSGKTTLLRAMTGELAHRGQITLNGREVAELPPERLALLRGVLPQATALSFPFTVAEIVGLGLQGAHGRQGAGLIVAALSRVGLAGFSGRLYQQLSGGEQQRVQLARVLVQVWEPVGEDGPRWLFLDEPVSSLDIAHQLGVMRLAQDYAERGGGVVAVMHDLNLTAMFADRVALILEGRLLAQGPPAEVLTDASLRTAYRCPLRVNTVPPDGTFILPHAVA